MNKPISENQGLQITRKFGFCEPCPLRSFHIYHLCISIIEILLNMRITALQGKQLYSCDGNEVILITDAVDIVLPQITWNSGTVCQSRLTQVPAIKWPEKIARFSLTRGRRCSAGDELDLHTEP